MSFTEQHKIILEKHKHHWDSLKQVGFMRNLDKPVFDELQQVHNEALSVQHFSSWCGECVADMIRTIYTQYDKQIVDTPTPTPSPYKKRYGK